jgi:hypothetical protein
MGPGSQFLQLAKLEGNVVVQQQMRFPFKARVRTQSCRTSVAPLVQGGSFLNFRLPSAANSWPPASNC